MLTYQDLKEAIRKVKQTGGRPMTYEEFIRIRQKNQETYEKLKGCVYIVKEAGEEDGTVHD